MHAFVCVCVCKRVCVSVCVYPRVHICTGTESAHPVDYMGSPRPHLRRDWAHPSSPRLRPGLGPCPVAARGSGSWDRAGFSLWDGAGFSHAGRFGLYVISVGIGISPAPEFLVNALKRPWTLSTSQANHYPRVLSSTLEYRRVP